MERAANVDFAASLHKARLHRTGLNQSQSGGERGCGVEPVRGRERELCSVEGRGELCHDLQRKESFLCWIANRWRRGQTPSSVQEGDCWQQLSGQLIWTEEVADKR